LKTLSLDYGKNITKIHSLANNLPSPNIAKHNTPKHIPVIEHSTIRPAFISYMMPLKKVETAIKALGVEPFLLFDGSEKNLLMAQKVQKCLNKIQEKNPKIPKFDLHFDNFEEAFEGRKSTAAVTEAYYDDYDKPNNLNIDVSFNIPKYKNMTAKGDLFRLKENPEYTSFESDFFHEFVHAYMARNDNENYEKLQKEHFDKETNKEILEKLGFYATGSKSEFAAEYFSFKMMGVDIKSEKLAKLYEECMGPKID
jgi:hypothetical protein